MGLLAKLRNIITADLGSEQHNAENPELVINNLIKNMESTLPELKASCAQAIAQKRKTELSLNHSRSKELVWEQKARLAVNKGRDDLAREALQEKQRLVSRSEYLAQTLAQHLKIVDNYQASIAQLEEKLKTAREKQQILFQRRQHAVNLKQAREEIFRLEGSEAFIKLEQIESQIQDMEIEADLINTDSASQIEKEIEQIESNHAVEQELKSIKAELGTPHINRTINNV